jgi:hypothetical protein
LNLPDSLLPVVLARRRRKAVTAISVGAAGMLVSFVRDGLLDARVNPQNLCQLVSAHVPSGNPVLQFEACQ